jgi:phage-related protein
MAIKIPIVTVFDNKGLKNAQSAIGKVGAGIKGAFKVAAGATAAVAALTTVGVAFAKAGEQAATSNARITQIAESMGLFGNQAGAVSKRLQDLAKDTALQTGMDINSIKATQAKLLTFKNLAATADDTGGSFDRATKAAIDLAAAGFGAAETNAVQLGKALQDPIKGITALARSGVTFTDQEKDKIRTLTESGQVLEAQNLILSAIETQVGGTALATANATDKMAQAFQIMKEDVGTAVLPLFEQITQLISTALTPVAQALTPIFTTLFAALIPIVEKALPVFVEILNSLTPILDTLLNAMQPILDALSPLVDVFIAVAEAVAPLIEQAMPIFVQLIEMLTPIVAKLIEAFIPLVQKLLPPLLRLIEALLPVLDLMIQAFTDYLLPVLLKLVEKALPPLIALIDGLSTGIEWLTKFLGPLYAALKPVLDGLLAFAGIKPGDLRKTINVSAAIDANAARIMGMQVPGGAGSTGGVGGTGLLGAPVITPSPTPGASGSAAARQASPLQSLIQESNKTAAVLKREGALERAGLTKEVAQWVTSSNKPIKAAREAQARIAKNGAKAVANLTKSYIKSAAGQQAAASAAAEASAQAQAAHNAMVAAAQAAAAREAAALAERERVYKAFQDSVTATFAGIKNAILGAFDLTQLGGSTNAITRNMDKLLTRLRSFATNVTKLSGMGLDPALLQQVIAAGPLAGARLAQTLVAGGANALNSINAGFNEFGALSSQIAQTGTESLFNRQAQQTIYNIEVSGGVGSGATIGKAIVDAIKSYERTSGAVFQGA